MSFSFIIIKTTFNHHVQNIIIASAKETEHNIHLFPN